MQPITKQADDVQKKKAGRLRRFAASAGVAAAILLHTILPLPQAKADEAPEPAASGVLPYPNFSEGGVHGNPAIWPQYGNWGRLEIGGDVANDKVLSRLFLSSRLFGELHGLMRIGSSFTSDATNTGVTGVLALPLFADIYIGESVGIDSKGSIAEQAGIAHILRTEDFLLRSGVDYDFVTTLARLGFEVRFPAGPLELTASANVRAIAEGENRGYAGQTIGAQVRYGRHIVSFGVGGRDIEDWEDLRLHYRVSPADGVSLDFYLAGRGRGLFENPSYAGIGIMRSF